jgi:hypothetical protein
LDSDSSQRHIGSVTEDDSGAESYVE